MKLRTWTYFFKSAFLNILHDRLIHLICMGTITISMLLFGAFLLLYVNLDRWINEWGESLSMSVYLEDGIDAKTRQGIEQALKGLRGADLKGYVSKDEAIKNLRQSLGDQAGLLDGLKDNPLPASFEIHFRDRGADRINPREIKKALEKIKGVNEVQYSEQWVERFEGVLYVFKIVGLIIGGFICIAVLFITTNTIKLTIYSRRNEIEIYKLVGATDWFVKLPYLIEGAIQGLVSGLVAFMILYLICSLLSLKTLFLFGLPVFDITFLSREEALSTVLLGLVLGITGGFIALGRFFRT